MERKSKLGAIYLGFKTYRLGMPLHIRREYSSRCIDHSVIAFTYFRSGVSMDTIKLIHAMFS